MNIAGTKPAHTYEGPEEIPTMYSWFWHTRSKPLYWLRDEFEFDLVRLWMVTTDKLPPKWITTDQNLITKCFIIFKNGDFPKELTPTDPSWQDEEGNTLAMLWIMFRHTKPPKSYAHDPFIKNHKGQTCMDLWKNIITSIGAARPK